jgi:cbb3-type cytochrome oxidase subunit 3
MRQVSEATVYLVFAICIWYLFRKSNKW